MRELLPTDACRSFCRNITCLAWLSATPASAASGSSAEPTSVDVAKGSGTALDDASWDAAAAGGGIGGDASACVS